MKLAEMAFGIADQFPSRELYGLTSQVKRSAISIPSNIAEGAGRNSTREFAYFLGVASGSRAELHTQIELALRLKFLNSESDIFAQLQRVAQLITALRKAIRARLESTDT